MNELRIVTVSKLAQAVPYLIRGFTPVELSLEGVSVCVIGDIPQELLTGVSAEDLEKARAVVQEPWDHHGKRANLEGVAVRSYRTPHFGSCRDRPWFLTTGNPDLDACSCILNLMGEAPHPSRAAEFAKAPPWLAKAMTRDMAGFFRLVNRKDVEPFGLKLTEAEGGELVLAWEMLSGKLTDALAFYTGVGNLRTILGPNPPTPLIDAALKDESMRLGLIAKAPTELISPEVVFVECGVWGMDQWWNIAPVVVWYNPQKPTDQAWFSVRDVPTAIGLFGQEGEGDQGKAGLQMVFPHLVPEGCGGRYDVGGGPRGVSLTRDQVRGYAEQIAARVIKK